MKTAMTTSNSLRNGTRRGALALLLGATLGIGSLAANAAQTGELFTAMMVDTAPSPAAISSSAKM